MSRDAILQVLLAAGSDPWAALVAKATLAMAVALLALRILRRAPASWRHLLAAGSFGALLVMPLVAGLAPARVVAVGAPRAAAPSVHRARPRVEMPTAVVRDVPAVSPPAAPQRISMGTALAALYGAGVLGVMASLVAGVLRLHRLHARSEVSVRGTRLARVLARGEGWRRGVQVVTSEELAAPMTFGFLRPVIVLPAGAEAWGEDDMTRALRHELEHVSRHDWATQLVSRVAFAFHWPHPFAWMLWRRLRLEAERACDDAVIRSQGQPETYAGQLVALARRVNRHDPVPALSMATRSHLGLRVEAILDAAARRAPRTRLATLAILGAVAFGLAGLAPLRVTRAQAPEATRQSANERQRTNDRGVDDQLASDVQVELQRTLEQEPQGAQAAPAAQDRPEPPEPPEAPEPPEVPEVPEPPEAPEPPEVPEARAPRPPAAPAAPEAYEDDGDEPGDDDDQDASLEMRLLQAAQRGSLAEMRRLIDAGAKADAVLRGDGTPLIGAARGGSVPAIELLLDAGANVNRGVSGDGSALIAAAQEGHLEAVRALLARGAAIDLGLEGDGNALIMASGAGHLDVVRDLLDRGAGIETVVPGDENALIHASEEGQADVVRLLIDRGANVNARVKAIEGPNRRVEWRTPLSMARRGGHAEVERILKAAGARE